MEKELKSIKESTHKLESVVRSAYVYVVKTVEKELKSIKESTHKLESVVRSAYVYIAKTVEEEEKFLLEILTRHLYCSIYGIDELVEEAEKEAAEEWKRWKEKEIREAEEEAEKGLTPPEEDILYEILKENGILKERLNKK